MTYEYSLRTFRPHMQSSRFVYCKDKLTNFPLRRVDKSADHRLVNQNHIRVKLKGKSRSNLIRFNPIRK